MRLPQDKLCRDLARALVSSGISFHAIEHCYFRHWVHELNPAFKLPRADALTQHADDVGARIRVKMLERIKKEARYISITTDAATTIRGDEIIAVTGHYISPDWNMNSVVLACTFVDESKTAQFLDSILQDMTDKDFVVTCTTGRSPSDAEPGRLLCVTDNGANFVAAVNLGVANHTISEGIHCACHTMNLWCGAIHSE
jgi:hypothetical protein